MPPKNPPNSVTDFSAIFSAAVQAVDESYLRVPVADSAPVIRERAFAYELYHQLRLMCGTTKYMLTGELEKASHPAMTDPKVKRLAPDLLLHVPGDCRGNFVAIEIKGGKPRGSGFQKDLSSLCFLRDQFGYERLIYLIYGVTGNQATDLAVAMKRLRTLQSRPAT
jgi:hypothetical protein